MAFLDFFKRKKVENATTVTSINGDSIFDVFGYGPSLSGPAVTENSALRLSAVHACVRIIAGSLSSLALHMYRRTAEGRDRISDDNLWWLLNEQPTLRYSAAAMWEFVAKSILLRGDAFVYIRRDLNGNIRELIPLHREQVKIEREDSRLNYYVQDNGQYFGVAMEDMLHFPGLGFDGIQSQSVISHYGRTSLGMNLASEEHAARFFGSGTMQKFALMQKGRMSPEALSSLRDQWQGTYGGAENAQKPLILVEGTEIKELTLSAADAQLLESRKFGVEDICRFFGVPPSMVGHAGNTSTIGSNAEEIDTAFIRYTLRPHLVRIEQELNRKFFRTAARFLEFELNSLMRGNTSAQAQYFSSALGGSGGSGWMTQNEIRKLSNLPPVEGGDTISTWASVQTPEPTPQEQAPEQAAAMIGVMTINEARARIGLAAVEGGDVLMSRAQQRLRFNEVTQKIEAA